MDDDVLDYLFDLYEELLQYDDMESQVQAASIRMELSDLDPTWTWNEEES